jgi:hypothetical protein
MERVIKEISSPLDGFLQGFGWCFQAEVERTAALGEVAVRPGAFNVRATSPGVAGRGSHDV